MLVLKYENASYLLVVYKKAENLEFKIIDISIIV